MAATRSLIVDTPDSIETVITLVAESYAATAEDPVGPSTISRDTSRKFSSAAAASTTKSVAVSLRSTRRVGRPVATTIEVSPSRHGVVGGVIVSVPDPETLTISGGRVESSSRGANSESVTEISSPVISTGSNSEDWWPGVWKFSPAPDVALNSMSSD